MWQRNLPIVFEFLFSDDGEKIFKSVCRWRFFVAIITNHTHHTETTTYLVRVSFDLVILKARLHWTFVVQQSATFVGKSWRSKSSSVDQVKTSANNVGDCWWKIVRAAISQLCWEVLVAGANQATDLDHVTARTTLSGDCSKWQLPSGRIAGSGPQIDPWRLIRGE